MNTNMPTEALENVAAEDRVAALEEENRKLRQLAHEADRLRRENETMRSKKRLGLVWEQESLEEEDAASNMAILPRLILTEDGRQISHLDGDTGNLVIEGDNLDALRLLSKSHKGKVDCIYIDPPYNTGKTTFIYNDRFVSEDHRWRKSLWLDFLHRRLLLARDLLSENGVILVSINDAHRAILELLMDEVMPGKRVGCFVWRTRQGKNEEGDTNLSTDHEHVLVYANPGFAFGGKEKTFAAYKFDDQDGRGSYRISDMTVNCRWDDKRAGSAYYPIQDPDTGIWYPANPDRVWAYTSRDRMKPGQKLKTKTMEEFIEDRKIAFPKKGEFFFWESMDDLLLAIDEKEVPVNGKGVPLLRRGLPGLEFFVGKKVGRGVPQFKRHKTEVKTQTQPISSWIRSTADKDTSTDEDVVALTSSLGGESDAHLKSIFGEKVFTYAKPPSLMRELLRQATQPDSIVVDFFAGSGSTAEAVLNLNQEDGGSRRFIMVSSTEASDEAPGKNICKNVCARRIESICNGYGSGKKQVKGTGDGFAYLRLDRVQPFNLEDVMDDVLAWTLIQIQHDRPFTAFAPENGVMIDDGGPTAIALCSEITDKALDTMRNATTKPMILYTEYPGYATEKLTGCAIEARPAYDTAIRIAK